MIPPVGKILPGPAAGEPVFEDLSGVRLRRIKRWGKVVLAVGLVWVLAVALLILNPGPAPVLNGAPGAEARVVPAQDPGPSDAGLLIAVKGTPGPQPGADATPAQGRPRCEVEELAPGAAIAAPNVLFPSRVYTMLPTSPENAFLPLLRNCGRIDVILPEWFEITGASLAVSRTDVDPEMQGAMASVQGKRRGEVETWPVFSLGRTLTAEVFLQGVKDKKAQSGLADRIVRAAAGMQAQGACLRLQDVKPKDAPALVPFIVQLAARARAARLELCLVASLSDQLWTSPEVVAHVGKVIVTAYQEPWIGAHPQPLAPLDWFGKQVAQIQRNVPAEKLVIAIGGHAVDWVSGQAVPERIGIAEAMFRISGANAAIDFSDAARNSYSSFFDGEGNRHQIWMLDAASVHNNLRVLQDLGISEIAVPSLGEEEPAYWDAVNGQLASSFGAPAFPDNVVFRGEGAFYRFASAAQTGQRLWRIDAKSGLIETLRYEVVPRPLEMERYGARAPRQIALTFDDGPDPVATARILDALKANDAPATFFVVGKAALASPELLQRAVAEGHVVGSHSFSHPHMEDLGAFRARAELSANRSLIEGAIGRSPLLFRPPYVRGPGPISEHEAAVFSILRDEGYSVTGSDIVPTDWAGISAEEIVRQVFAELGKTGGNVIVLHDGKSSGMHTAEAVALLVPELRARGYEIVPLPVLLGTTAEAVMPSVGLTASVFKGFSVSVIGLWIALLTVLFWFCIFASVLRSALYLFLASRRDPVYPRSFAGLPSVTVIVPAYNEEKVIVPTVQSILASDYGNLSCIVVDDGSTDGTLRVLDKAFGNDPRVRVLTQANQGKWQALNLAFQRVDSEIAVCVDADTRIAPDAIDNIVRPFADSKVAAVAGTVVVANTSNLLTKFQSIEYITAQQIGRRAQEHLNGILVVPGALGAWRIDAVRDVGFYSNETLTEDADLTIWLRRGGYRVAYAENARSRTEAPADIRSLLKQRLRWSFGNLQTLWKHRRALVEFGPKRVFSMIDMIFFGFLLPILSPVLDLLFLIFLTNLWTAWQTGEMSEGIDISVLGVVGVAMVQAMDIVVAWIAHGREGEKGRMKLILLVPLMNILYRPLLYITVYRALWAALTGRLARWNKLRRLGIEPKNRQVTAR